MKLRLVEKDGSVEWVEYEGNDLPESVLVRRPFFSVLGSRYRLQFPELRCYRYVSDELLPSRPQGLTG